MVSIRQREYDLQDDDEDHVRANEEDGEPALEGHHRPVGGAKHRFLRERVAHLLEREGTELWTRKRGADEVVGAIGRLAGGRGRVGPSLVGGRLGRLGGRRVDRRWCGQHALILYSGGVRREGHRRGDVGGREGEDKAKPAFPSSLPGRCSSIHPLSSTESIH
jgi:hypothetical protein